MRTKLLQTFAVSVALGMVGCGAPKDKSGLPPGGDTGGANSINPAGVSGSVQSAGSAGRSGSAGVGNTGNAAGGAPAPTGGANAAGKGGSGNPATGGAASGGNAGAGSATTRGGAGGGGVGGRGAAAGGAGIGNGGAGTAGTSSGCNMGTTHTGGKQYCSNSIGNVGNGYSYQLWSNGQGSGCMTVFASDATFKSNWSNVGDFLARVGLGWDSSKTYDQLGTISSDFAFTKSISGGLTYIGIYGWSVGPLIEYYIIEDWVGSRPTGGGTKMGTFTIAGEGAYDVYQHTQVNQPSITGSNATFPQFFSVRQTARQCGHISISEHFKQWASMGLQLGKMEEARILVEAINNSGSIELTTATMVVN